MWNHYRSNLLKIWFLIIICNIGIILRKVVAIAADCGDVNPDCDKKFLRYRKNDSYYGSTQKRQLSKIYISHHQFM